MFGTIPVNVVNVLTALAISLLVIGGAVFTFKILWIKHYDFYFPKGHYHVEEIEDNDDETLQGSTVSLYFKILKKILTDLDAEYWMKYTGFDGYCYMLFQRRLIIAFLLFFFGNLIIYVSLYLYLIIFQGTTVDLKKLTKMEKFEWMNHFYICMSLTLMTLIMLWTIITMRRNLQAHFYYSHISSELDHGLNYLKLRTVDVEVTENHAEITSHKLTGVVKTELRNHGKDATINSALVMPDLHVLFELESERADLITTYGILSKHKPPWKMVLPKEMVDPKEYKKKLDELDFKIDKQLMQPLKPSRTAFMSLNSLKSISYLKTRYSKDTLVRIKETFEEARTNADAFAARVPFFTQNPFYIDNPKDNEGLLQPDENEDLDKTYVPNDENEFKITVKTFLNPLDVNWQYVVAEKDDFMCKKILLNLASISVLIFLTTPTALLNVMTDDPKDANVKNLAAKWSQRAPGVLRFLVISLLPPLIVISVNSILIFFIHTLVDWENKNRFSSYQKAIMVNCFVYFIFNMLIVPGFAATAFSNLYELLGTGIGNVGLLFRELFNLDSGDFFVILVLQQAGVSFFIQLTSVIDLFTYYLSPYITLNMRFVLSGRESWRKTNKTVFAYGMAYAQQLVFVAIGIVFGSTVLIIPLAVIFYFVVRHIADAHQLLIWHRAEIESSGSLIHTATVRIMVSLLIAQASVFFKQLFTGNIWSISYMVVMMAFTSTFLYFLDRRPLITPDKFPEDDEKLDIANLHKWWNNFAHPLAAKADPRLDKTASILFYEGLSKPQRKESREWLQHVYHEKNNLPKLGGDKDDEDLIQAISRSNNIGAKPKNPLELMAQRLQNLYTKKQGPKAEQ